MTGEEERRRGMVVAIALVVVSAAGLLAVGGSRDTGEVAAPHGATSTTEVPTATTTTTPTTTTAPVRLPAPPADVDGDGVVDPLSLVAIDRPDGALETRLVAELSRLGRKEAGIDRELPPPVIAAVLDMDGDGRREILIQTAEQIGLRHFIVVRLAGGVLREVVSGDQPFGVTTGRGVAPSGGLVYAMGLECRDAARGQPGRELVIKEANNDSPADSAAGGGGDIMYGRVLVAYFDGHETGFVMQATTEEQFSVHDEAKMAEYSRTSCGTFTG